MNYFEKARDGSIFTRSGKTAKFIALLTDGSPMPLLMHVSGRGMENYYTNGTYDPSEPEMNLRVSDFDHTSITDQQMQYQQEFLKGKNALLRIK